MLRRFLIETVLGIVFLTSSISKVLNCFEFINTNKFISVQLNSFEKIAQLNHSWQKLSLRHGVLFYHTISRICFQSGAYMVPVFYLALNRWKPCDFFVGFLCPKNSFYLSAFAKEDVKIMSLQQLRLTAI